MRTILQKICFVLLAVTLLTPAVLHAQIDYYENFPEEGTNWTNLDFQITDVAVCTDGYAFRANPVNDLGTTVPVETVSKSIGVSNGELLTLTYDYKLLVYDPDLPYVAVDGNDWGYFFIQYGATQNGPWQTVDIVEPVNHTASTNCTTRVIEFMPPANKPVFLRIVGDAGTDLQSSYYLYIDNISALQDTITIDPVLEKDDMLVYPTPVNDYLNINFDDAFVTEVTLYDPYGQEVEVPFPSGTLTQLDMSGLEKGQYVLHIMADNELKIVSVMKE